MAIGLGINLSTHAQIPSYVPTNGLVGWWPFNGNANDESGNNNNGTVNGATLSTDRNGIVNNSYLFNGTSDKITFQSKFQFHNSGDASISIWIKTISIPSGIQATFLKSKLTNSDNNRFNFFANPKPNNKVLISLDYRESNTTLHALNIDTINLNNWHHLTYTRSGNSYKLYIDGVFQNITTDNNPVALNEIGWLIGNDPSSSHDFNGIIDDISIYNRALTQQEITSLYESCALNPVVSNQTA
jgi:hypothetical protein